jgi:hypothetical protein
MTEKKWKSCTDPGVLLEYLRGSASGRKLRLFAVACCRPILKKRDAFHGALDIAEAVAEGKPGRRLQKGWDEWAARAMEAGDPIGWAVHFALDDDATIGNLDREFTDWVCGLRSGVAERDELARHVALLRCLFGNPFRPITFSPDWRTGTAVTLARQMYDGRDFSTMPILADALQDASCDSDDILNHCRSDGVHVRGCWVVDLVLEKA